MIGRDRATGAPSGEEGRRHQAARRGHEGATVPSRYRRRHRALPTKSNKTDGKEEGLPEE